MSTTEERLAHNQAVFRAANEAIIKNPSERSALRTFICECGEESCMTAIQLTHADYDALRSNPRHFALARGHESEGDSILEERAGYTLVEKLGDAASVVERDADRPPSTG